MTRTRRRLVLYGVGIAAAAGLLFAGYGVTVPAEKATLLNSAAFLAGLGQTGQAIATCDDVIRAHPDDVEARVFRATFLAMAGRHDEALRAYDDAIARAKDAGTKCDLVLDRASILLRLGRTQEFQAERDRLAAMGAGYRLDVCEGLWAEKEGAWGAAVVAYGRAFELRPTDEQVKGRLYATLLEQGRDALGAGKFDDARASFDRAKGILPRAPEARLRGAEVRLAVHDADGAVVELRAAGRRTPGIAPLLFRAATLLLEAGRREEALDALAAALVADRTGTTVLLRNETVWRDEVSQADVRELLESEQPSTRLALTADGGVIHDPRTSAGTGTVR